ncbi:MAG: hypothetical protein IT578_00120 [Verrucomicrobiae bacterium]|nr:hypothetical protein [Verrucomicrobiae bacterium]
MKPPQFALFAFAVSGLILTVASSCPGAESIRFDLTKAADGRCMDDARQHHALVVASESDNKANKEGLHLGSPGDRVEIPMEAFPGERGSVRIVFKGDPPVGPLLHLYTPKDGLWLTIEPTRILFSLYRRSGNDYLRTFFPITALARGDWNDLTASWESGKGLMLLLNGRVLASLPINDAFAFERNGYLVVGAHQPPLKKRGGGEDLPPSFQGSLREVVISTAPSPFQEAGRGEAKASLATAPPRTLSAPAPSLSAPVPPKANPFPSMGEVKGIEAVKTASAAGLYNRHMGILFNAKTGELEGVWNARGVCLAVPGGGRPADSLWQVTLRSGKTEVVLTPRDFRTVNFKTARAASGVMTLEGRYSGCTVPGASCEVTASVTMHPDAPEIAWNFRVSGVSGPAGIWRVSYPGLLLPPLGGDAARSRYVNCYRQGGVANDPFHLKTGGAGPYPRVSSYPSANGLMQFQALYNEDSGEGLYLATEDGRGFKKDFRFDGWPAQQRICYSVVHYPAGRGGTLKEYVAPFSLRMVPYRGGWYEAAQMYRSWLLKQEWFAKGPLQSRADIPNWLREAPIFVKISGAKFGELEGPAKPEVNTAILEGFSRLRKIFGHDFPVVFYSWRKLDRSRCAYGGDCLAHLGHLDVPRLTLTEVFKPLQKEGIHLVTYINSKIYDQKWAPSDLAEAEKWAVRDEDGNICLYNPKELPAWVICNGTDWWNRRFGETACAEIGAMASNGTYMDSFGKGGEECFAANHGHPSGGGDELVQGQRRMAKAVKEAVRKLDSEHILGGEASTESYADLLDYTILSLNYYNDYAPLRRAVYGDYMLCHGRSIPSAQQSEQWKIEVSTLFLEGAILGRANMGAGAADIEADKACLEKLVELADYTRNGIEYLRYGQLLPPPVVGAGGSVGYTPTGKKLRVEAPAVGAVAYRSHKDGSAAVVFFNRGGEECSFDHAFSAGLRRKEDPTATLSVMDRKGVRTKLASFRGEHKETVRLAPGEVRFYVLQ